MDTLRFLVENTDGRAIVNQNDLSKGLQQMLTDSATHLPARLQLDDGAAGREVPQDRCARQRPRMQVRARPDTGR